MKYGGAFVTATAWVVEHSQIALEISIAAAHIDGTRNTGKMSNHCVTSSHISRSPIEVPTTESLSLNKW